MKLRKSRTTGTPAGEEVREDLLPPGMAVEPYMVLESVCKKIQPTFLTSPSQEIFHNLTKTTSSTRNKFVLWVFKFVHVYKK